MAASKEMMGKLHQRLAALMLEELEWYNDPKRNEDQIPMPAADKSAISKFLKDNDVTCDPLEGGDIARLKEEFENRRQASKAAVIKASADDLDSLYGPTH